MVRALVFPYRGPGSIPGPGVPCRLSLSLVLVLALRVFSASSGFPPSTDTNIPISVSTWKQWTSSAISCNVHFHV